MVDRKQQQDEEAEIDLSGLAGIQLDSNMDPLAMVRRIEAALAEAEADTPEVEEDSFGFPLAEAVPLIPEKYRRQVPPEALQEKTVICAQKLFPQLSQGKLEMTVADLAYHIPRHLYYHAALEDQTVVRLPLDTVVRSIGLDAFRSRTPGITRFYDIAEMEDPFKEMEPSPEAVADVVLEDAGAAVVLDEDPPVGAAKADALPDVIPPPKPTTIRMMSAEVPSPRATMTKSKGPLAHPDIPPQAAPPDIPPPRTTIRVAPAVVAEPVETQAPVEPLSKPAVPTPDSMMTKVVDMSSVPAPEIPAPKPAMKTMPIPRPKPTRAMAPASVEPVASGGPVEPEVSPGVPMTASPAAVAEPEPMPASETEFVYPAVALLRLLPPESVIEGAMEAAVSISVIVNIPDLYDQLREGRVELTVGAAASYLKPEWVTHRTLANHKTQVVLSLGTIVASIGVDGLKKRTPPEASRYDLSRMPDPFAEPAELQSLDLLLKKRPKPAAMPPPPFRADEGSDGAVAGTNLASTPQVVKRPAGGTGAESEFYELPGNVNINAAPIDELLMLGGMDKALAESIIAYREKNTEFKSIFDLMQVPGMTGARFKRMTGIPAGQKKEHRRLHLANLLGLPVDQVSNLSLVATAVATKPGFTGCIISDWDGIVLAQEGLSEGVAVNLSAVLPRMTDQIRHNIDLVGADPASTFTVSMGSRLYTVVPGRNVLLTTVHTEVMVPAAELPSLEKVVRELTWLISLRAYVGPTVPAERFTE